MTLEFETLYDDAVKSGLLPGFALLAASKDGKFTYSKVGGTQSLDPKNSRPFGLDTVCWIASCTKAMTAIAALQLSERGLVKLDDPVSDILPEVGRFGVIEGWDDEKNEGIYKPVSTPVTLRMLLTHTAGYTYEPLSPNLLKFRASRNEEPLAGATVEAKSDIPLIFEPGTAFAYGQCMDWVGKLVERVTKSTLQEYFRKNIWEKLDMKDIGFFPAERPEWEGRLSGTSTLNEKGEGPAVDVPDYDGLGGATDCFGGSGSFTNAETYFKVTQAILRRDTKLLQEDNWDNFFKPQFDEKLKEKLKDAIEVDPLAEAFLGMRIPREVSRNWAFGGLVAEDGIEGRAGKGTVTWGGMPSQMWFVDEETGLCGLALNQVIPPMAPAIMALHEQFHKGIFQKYKASKA